MTQQPPNAGFLLGENWFPIKRFRMIDYEPGVCVGALVIEDYDRQMFGSPKVGDKIIVYDNENRLVPSEYFDEPTEVDHGTDIWDISRLTDWSESL